MSTPDNPKNDLSYASNAERHAWHLKDVLRNRKGPASKGAEIEIMHGNTGDEKNDKTIHGVIQNAGQDSLLIDLDPSGYEIQINLGTKPEDSFEYVMRDARGTVVSSGRSGTLKKVEITSKNPLP